MNLACSGCGSTDWISCDPGDVPVTDDADEAQDCAAVAWCRSCDPLIVRAA